MIKVRIQTTCEFCNGEAYIPIGEFLQADTESLTRYLPCVHCHGSGEQKKWVSLSDLAQMLEKESAGVLPPQNVQSIA